FEIKNNSQSVALSFPGKNLTRFKSIVEVAEGIMEGWKGYSQLGLPVIVVTEKDIAKVIGQTLLAKAYGNQSLGCIDSISIDIGKPVANKSVLPVVIKTLVFN